MVKCSSYSKDAHRKKLHEIAHRSIANNVRKPLPLNTIKVGQVVFLRERISDGPNDYSPGGTYGYRGDAVIVKSIDSYQDRDATPNPDYCTVKYRYAVAHCDYNGDERFVVDRHEISPFDPLLTFNEQQEYLKNSTRYKTLEDRFKGSDYVNCYL